MSVISSCVKCSGEYIQEFNCGCFDRVKFDEGYILNVNNPVTMIDNNGKLIVGYVIALPDGTTKFALVGEIKVSMLRKMTELL